VGLQFVRGHCGWDVLTLVVAGRVPREQELGAALKIIDAPVSGGLEVGFLEKGPRPGEVILRVADSTARDWIPMCGGMSLVIGKAMVETGLRDVFGIDVKAPRVELNLVTASGEIPLRVEVESGKARRVTASMSQYASYLYDQGMQPLVLNGVEALHVGDFVVVALPALEAGHPGLDFTRRDSGPHLDVVHDLLRDYREFRKEKGGVMAMLFDERPEGAGKFRLFPRFSEASAARIPYEFQCGTGTMAVAVALARAGKLPFAGEQGSIVFEWGNPRVTPDPYGIRTSQLDLRLQNRRIVEAHLSHSVVEILAEGVLTLPAY
jgi:hypothetical protein